MLPGRKGESEDTLRVLIIRIPFLAAKPYFITESAGGLRKKPQLLIEYTESESSVLKIFLLSV